jgi:predicted amidohydrolase YtcJ
MRISRLTVLVAGGGPCCPVAPAADLVLVNGTILVDANNSVAGGGGHDGKIVAVGSTEAIGRAIGSATEVVDRAAGRQRLA